MFRIPEFNNRDMTFEEAKTVMTGFGRGDMLEGMMAMDRVWQEHASGSPRFEYDEDFYDCYEAEVNAYNTVYSTMKPLFS